MVKSSFKHQMWCIVLIAFGVSVLSPRSAMAAQGVQSPATSVANLYNARRFPEALSACEASIKEHPLDANLRYWHASILVKMQRMSEARQEFEYVATYSTNKIEKEYALRACQSFDASSPGASPASAPTQSAIRGPGDRITQQADFDSNNILMDGARRQNNVNDRARLQSQYNLDMQDVNYMSTATVQVGNQRVPKYSPEQIQAARNAVVEKANQRMYENDRRAAGEMQSAQQKAFETQASAANLADQIKNSSKTGFHLQENGTNLYVRQYSAPPNNSSSAYNPNPAMVNIDDSATARHGQFDSPMQATARSLDPAVQKQLDMEAKKNVRSNVFGHLYPSEDSSAKRQ